VSRKFIIAMLLMLILAASAVAYFSFQNLSGGSFNSVENDSSQNVINIIFKYGTGARNELNTFEGTYTKDMVMDNPITTRMILSQEELRQIQQRITEMDLFSFPDNFPINPSGEVIPQTDYYIKVQNGTQTKEISWSTSSLMDSNIQNSLEQLVSFLRGMIEQKPECKALPEARGAYC
jgi:secreted PhoX family phosphatase